MALFTLKGLNRRRWELFKANRRGLLVAMDFRGAFPDERVCADHRQ